MICELVYVQVAMVDYTSLRSHQIYSTINLITNTAVVGKNIPLLQSIINTAFEEEHKH